MQRTLNSAHELPAPPLVRADDGLVSVGKIVFTVERIVELSNPVRVIAFGSRARGTHSAQSDLDLAIVVEEYDARLGLPPVNRVDIDVWMPMDLVVYDLDRESHHINSLNSLQAEIAAEGIVLYDRTKGIVDRRAAERLV